MSEPIIEERWTFGTSLQVQSPGPGHLYHKTLYSELYIHSHPELPVFENENWLLTSISSPNVLEGWKIKSVMFLYRIRYEGIIDKIGLRDGINTIHLFDGLSLGNNNWQMHKSELPSPQGFRFGIGISIHVISYPRNVGILGDISSTQFQFASIGLEFIKSSDQGPIIEPHLI